MSKPEDGLPDQTRPNPSTQVTSSVSSARAPATQVTPAKTAQAKTTRANSLKPAQIYDPKNPTQQKIAAEETPEEIGGRDGLEPTRYGDWEKNGRCIDF